MVEEYRIEKIHRKCASCGREFRYGEDLYTAVVTEDDRFLRKDYCLECWKPSPDEIFSYWKSTFPEKARPNIEDMGKVQTFFDRLLRREDDGENLDGVRFFTALVLVRKKRLRLLGTRSEGGAEWIRVEKVWDGEKVDIRDPGIEEDQLDRIREQMEQLFEMELSAA